MSEPIAMEAPHAARSLRANVAANYASLAFGMVATIVAMPVYLRLLGVEAFGLVGFFTLLNAGFQVFDAGLSQTFARECARFSGGARDIHSLRRLLATFEITFFVIAAAGSGAIVLGAPLLASGWLHAQKIPLHEIVVSIVLMGVAVPCQWVSGLYRGVLIGLERQVWLSGFNIAFATARSFGVIGALLAFGREPNVFFGYQSCLAVLELIALIAVSRAVLRAPVTVPSGPLPWGEFRGVLRFSSAVAFTAVAWLLLTQGDKLVLSKVLSLAAYGVFTLAATASGAVAGLGVPIAQAILPRLTRLNTSGETTQVVALYRRATQLTCLVALPPALVLACFAQPAIWVWTGDARIAGQAAPILTAYAIGGGLATLAVFPYYLQYSYGALRLHVIGQVLMLAILAPALLVAATRWGAVGTGVVWTALNAAYILLWTPVVHRRFAPGLHSVWLWQDIAPIAAASAACAIGLALVLKWPPGRLEAAVELISVSSAVLLAGLLASPAGRAALRTELTAWREARMTTLTSNLKSRKQRLSNIWLAIRTFVGGVLLRNPWRALNVRRLQDQRLSSLNTSTERAIIFLVPGYDGVTGGMLSINSIVEETKKLRKIHHADSFVCPIPSEPPLSSYSFFDNSISLVNFYRLIKALSPTCKSVLIHVPEYFSRSANFRRCLAEICDAGMILQTNILLQNIDFCPTPGQVQRIREFGEVTVTTAHVAYGTSDTARRLGCRLFHLSTWVSPERFLRAPFSQKRDVFMISPDPHPMRDRVLRVLRKAFPKFEFIVISKMSYREYRQVCSSAKFSLTFGEGLDGYYVESIFSGGVSIAVYNDRFFTERYKGTPLLFNDWRQLAAQLPTDLRALNDPEKYKAIQQLQFETVCKDYAVGQYERNIRHFYEHGAKWKAADTRS